MAEIDLDAMRAARQEATKEGHLVRFGGQEFALPGLLPLSAALAYNRNDDAAFLLALLGDGYEAFMGLGPSVEDVADLARSVLDIYAVSPGKSDASPSPSNRNGTRPRRTSSGSTRST